MGFVIEDLPMSLPEVMELEGILRLSEDEDIEVPRVDLLSLIATLWLIADGAEEQRARMAERITELEARLGPDGELHWLKDENDMLRSEVAMLRGEVPRVEHGALCPCEACVAAYGPLH